MVVTVEWSRVSATMGRSASLNPRCSATGFGSGRDLIAFAGEKAQVARSYLDVQGRCAAPGRLQLYPHMGAAVASFGRLDSPGLQS